MKKIYIYGASGHGLVVADIARSCGYTETIFIDDGDNEYPSFDQIKQDTETPLALAVGSNSVRRKLFAKAKTNGFNIVTLIHPTAYISQGSKVGIGTVVMPNVVVNTDSIIGEGVILNSSAVIEHENTIEDFTHVSPNVALAGGVCIKQNTHVGIGTSVIQGVTIGENCVIGAGSVIVKNIEKNSVAYGNPCKVVRKADG